MSDDCCFICSSHQDDGKYIDFQYCKNQHETNHVHYHCLILWFKKSFTCPLCNTVIEPENSKWSFFMYIRHERSLLVKYLFTLLTWDILVMFVLSLWIFPMDMVFTIYTCIRFPSTKLLTSIWFVACLMVVCYPWMFIFMWMWLKFNHEYFDETVKNLNEKKPLKFLVAYQISITFITWIGYTKVSEIFQKETPYWSYILLAFIITTFGLYFWSMKDLEKEIRQRYLAYLFNIHLDKYPNDLKSFILISIESSKT